MISWSPPPRSASRAILNVFLLVLLELFVFQFYQAVRYRAMSPWVVNDWLINYSGGFVRRGLAGSLLLWLAEHIQMDVYLTITLFVHSLFIVVAVTYLGRLLVVLEGRDSPLALSLLLFTPSLLLFPLLDPNAFGRKEILLILVQLANLHLIRQTLPRDRSSGAVKAERGAADRYGYRRR
jgi:hypothetical protein